MKYSIISRSILLLAAGLAALLMPACARDVTGGSVEDIEPTEMRVFMQTEGEFDADSWYYWVVNFSKAPTIDPALSPIDSVATETRGRNWELFVMFHRDQASGDQLLALQRPRTPTFILTETGPIDAVAANFSAADSTPAETDLVVACRDADVLQLVKGRKLELILNRYFEDADTLDETAGPAPLRVHATDFEGDGDADLIVLYAGRGAAGAPVLRFYTSDGDTTFTLRNELPITDTPVDSIFVDADTAAASASHPEILVLTKAADGQGTLRVFDNDGNNNWLAAATVPVGINPVSVSPGSLDADNLDVVVANAGPDGGDGSVSVLLGNGTGGFTAGPVLPVTGQTTGAAIARFFGTGNDVVYSALDSGGTGSLGVYLKEAAEDFAAAPITIGLGDRPQALAAFDDNHDNIADAYVVNGIPGSNNSALLIQRGAKETVDSVDHFIWNDIQIGYQTALEPNRIVPANLNGDDVNDLIIPCPADRDNGNRICLFYGLGKWNYTNSDVYWTDQPPVSIQAFDWFLGVQTGPNSIELTIDPRVFYDLTLERPDSFICDWMTANASIQVEDEHDPQTGIVTEHFETPVAPQFKSGDLNNNQTTPIVNTNESPPSRNLIDWEIELL